MNKLAKLVSEKSFRKIIPIPATSAIDSFQMLAAAYGDYKKLVQIEETKRHEISAKRDVALERIRAQRDVMESYLSKIFEERQGVIHNLFERMDQAIESGNNELLDKTMSGVLDYAKTSPLAQAIQFMSDMNNENVDHIEI